MTIVGQRAAKEFKVVVVGDSGCGKTSLTYRFCEDKYVDNLGVTISADVRIRAIDVNGERCILHFWDTAGQERFMQSLTPMFFRNADAIVFVYDVSNNKSFTSLTKWMDSAAFYCDTNPVKILIGNKCDREHVVSRNRAQQYADNSDLRLFITSAKLNPESNTVSSIFSTLASLLLERERTNTRMRNPVRGVRVVMDTTNDNSSNCGC